MYTRINYVTAERVNFTFADVLIGVRVHVRCGKAKVNDVDIECVKEVSLIVLYVGDISIIV